MLYTDLQSVAITVSDPSTDPAAFGVCTQPNTVHPDTQVMLMVRVETEDRGRKPAPLH